ncbi:APC family permease [Amnibacterium flavum]|uniref:Amino acid transporter n=1 Tax=Amnibacterium flavum TaxID=2173173 RepID=A0A2V1HVR4_9MICO|nr:APC family permease [Amnibacterium flavum]PVZ95130.1 amino acid transporter [Amnibacterium flavum]
MTSTEAPSASNARRAVLGVPAIAFLVVSAASPLSVALGSAPLALLFGGPGAAVGFLVIGVVLALFAVAFLPMTRYVAAPGAFYSYIERGLGRASGNGAALMTLLAYASLAVCGFALFGVYGSTVLTGVAGVATPWWIPALVAVAIVVALGQLNIQVNARLLGVLLVIEMVVLAVISVSILVQGGAMGLSLDAFAPQNVFTPTIAIAILFAFASCLGIESTVVYRAEARDPDRTIKRSLFVVIAFIALFHTFFLWLLVQAAGPDVMTVFGADPAGAVLAIADRYAGPWASTVLVLLVLVSILASCLAFHNMLNRYAAKLAGDRLLPRAFATITKRGAPRVGGLTQGALAVVVIAVSLVLNLDPYLQTYILVSTPGVVGMLVTMTLTALAALVFFIRTSEVARRRILIAVSAVSTALFSGLVLIVVQQLDYLTGLGPVANTLLVLPPVIAFAAGALVTVARSRNTALAPAPVARASETIES